jgi:hypothetical protein
VLLLLDQRRVIMAESQSMDREDPRLQADPVLCLSDGRATLGQKLFSGIVAIIVVMGTVYGLVHQRGEVPRRTTMMAVSGATVPTTVGQRDKSQE